MFNNFTNLARSILYRIQIRLNITNLSAESNIVFFYVTGK